MAIVEKYVRFTFSKAVFMGNICLLELADAHHMICNNVGMECLVKAKATYFKSNRSSSL